MPSAIVCFSCQKNDFDGSSFALWRRLWFHRLKKESFALGEKKIHHIMLPVSANQLSLLGNRTKQLLLRRSKEEISSHSVVLLHPALTPFPDYRAMQSNPNPHAIAHLLTDFLPDILSCMYRQWGFSLQGKTACIISESGTFLPVCEALAPYIRSLYVITHAYPVYRDLDYAWEKWGLTVCFQTEIPDDAPLVILSDTPEHLPSLPSSAELLDLTGTHECPIAPSSVFCRFPGTFSALASILGGITLPTLATILEAFYEEAPTAKTAKNAGFSISRLERKNGKFYC